MNKTCFIRDMRFLIDISGAQCQLRIDGEKVEIRADGVSAWAIPANGEYTYGGKSMSGDDFIDQSPWRIDSVDKFIAAFPFLQIRKKQYSDIIIDDCRIVVKYCYNKFAMVLYEKHQDDWQEIVVVHCRHDDYIRAYHFDEPCSLSFAAILIQEKINMLTVFDQLPMPIADEIKQYYAFRIPTNLPFSKPGITYKIMPGSIEVLADGVFHCGSIVGDRYYAGEAELNREEFVAYLEKFSMKYERCKTAVEHRIVDRWGYYTTGVGGYSDDDFCPRCTYCDESNRCICYDVGEMPEYFITVTEFAYDGIPGRMEYRSDVGLIRFWCNDMPASSPF